MKEAAATNPPRQRDAVTKPSVNPASSVSRIGEIDTKNQIKPVASSAPKSVAPQSPQPADVSSGTAAATPVKAKAASANASVSDEQIRQRAYELYVESGYQDGQAEQHWFAAEDEIQKKAK